jgi:hypothetical protein
MPAESRTGEKTSALSFRVNDSERSRIQNNALAANLTVGEYVRRCALGRDIVHKADTAALAQLRSLGGLLKHLHNEGLGHDAQTQNLLLQIDSALAALQK